jgi:hypothetical protein
MKKLIYSILIGFTLCSCGTPTIIPISSKYSKQINFETTKSKDEVWAKVIELFATKGMGIGVIDKSSWLITSLPTSFINGYSFENKEGQLINKDAMIVLDTHTNVMGNAVSPTEVNGSWNVRLFDANGKTSINVNLTNIKAILAYSLGYGRNGEILFDAKSTGVFEKQVAEYVR